MQRLRRAILALAAFWAVSSSAASAAEFRNFDQAAFSEAQAAGRPILIDVFAPWCPVCRAQAPIIRARAADPALHTLVVFRIDFDHQRAAWTALNVRRQSTLIAFHGPRETGRLVAVTEPEAIADLMRSATQ